jgi:hypothetical protein
MTREAIEAAPIYRLEPLGKRFLTPFFSDTFLLVFWT